MTGDEQGIKMTPVEDFLVFALEEWPDASWATESARTSEDASVVELRDGAFTLIESVLTHGLMLAGDVIGDDFVPWTCTAAEAVARIRVEWLSAWPDEIPLPGDIARLKNTEAGERAAQAALDRLG